MELRRRCKDAILGMNMIGCTEVHRVGNGVCTEVEGGMDWESVGASSVLSTVYVHSVQLFVTLRGERTDMDMDTETVQRLDGDTFWMTRVRCHRGVRWRGKTLCWQ